MPTRNYSSIAQPTSITTDITAGQTTMSVGSSAGYPATPFVAAINHTQPGKAEAVLVTGISGLTWTVTRGFDGTPARDHKAGASVVHTAIALDYREAQQRMDALEAGPYKINVPTGMPPNLHGQVVDRATRNMIPNPSFEVNLAGWTPGSSTAGAAPILTRDSGGQIGNFVATMAFPTGAADAYIDTDHLPVGANAECILSSWIWASREFSGSQLRFFVFFYDAANAFLTSTSKNVEYYPRRGARRHSLAFTTPANTANVRVRLYKDNVDLGAASVYSDNWQLELRGPIAGIPSSYCDGSLGPGYSWEGTPHASPSRRAAGTHVSSERSNMIATEAEVRYLSTQRLYLSENSDASDYGAKRGVIHVEDHREKNYTPAQFPPQGTRWDFVDNGVLGIPGGGFSGVQTIAPWGDDSGGGVHQIAYSQAYDGTIYHRYGVRSGAWGPWRPLGLSNQAGWTNVPTFANGWVAWSAGEHPQVRKTSDGMVVMRGIIKSGTMDVAAMNIPAGFRPGRYQRFATTPRTAQTAPFRMDVNSDGWCYPKMGDNAEFSVDNITFYAEN